MKYIKVLNDDYHWLFDIFMLIPKIMILPELSNLIIKSLQLEKYFKIRQDA